MDWLYLMAVYSPSVSIWFIALAGLVSVHVLLFWLVEYRLMIGSKLNDEHLVWLHDWPADAGDASRGSSKDVFSGLLYVIGLGAGFFIEYVILCRYTMFGYKNNANVNARFFSAFGVAVFFAVALGLCSSLGDLMGAIKPFAYFPVPRKVGALLLPFIFGVYALERKSLTDKWIYLASLYNEVQKQKDVIISDRLMTALAVDLVDMEMWSHKSFSEIFFTSIMNANIELRRADKLDSPIDPTSKKLSRKKVRRHLTKYQELVLDPKSKEVKDDFKVVSEVRIRDEGGRLRIETLA